ncbi:sugar phosphate nucleotidyltransferase [Candidatus Omnitrophota bacterium]
MKHRKTLAIILGGGKGTRLYPLTKERCKPAISFGGKYRLIDIPISNCLHSGVNKIFILTQFLTASIHRHIFQTYRLDMLSRGFIEVLPAEQTLASDEWYQGTADAVRRSVRYIKNLQIDDVLILSGDQLCRMNYNEMLDFHRKRKAGLTVIGHPVNKTESKRMGIMKTNVDGRVKKLVEKPQDLSLVEGFQNPDGSYIASTGNYIFKRDVLLDVLEKSKEDDFGREIIPNAIENYNVYMYPFNGYWEDIGTIKSFFYANLDLGAALPQFNLYDEQHQIFTHGRFLPAAKVQESTIKYTLISEGSMIEKGSIESSVIGIRSVIKAGAVIKKSIIMGNDFYERRLDNRKVKPSIGKNVRIEGAIIDKNVTIGNNVKIRGLQDPNKNFDHALYCVRDGIVVISKGTKIPAGKVIKG